MIRQQLQLVFFVSALVIIAILGIAAHHYYGKYSDTKEELVLEKALSKSYLNTLATEREEAKKFQEISSKIQTNLKKKLNETDKLSNSVDSGGTGLFIGASCTSSETTSTSTSGAERALAELDTRSRSAYFTFREKALKLESLYEEARLRLLEIEKRGCSVQSNN